MGGTLRHWGIYLRRSQSPPEGKVARLTVVNDDALAVALFPSSIDGIQGNLYSSGHRVSVYASLAGSGPSLFDPVNWVHGPHDAVCPHPESSNSLLSSEARLVTPTLAQISTLFHFFWKFSITLFFTPSIFFLSTSKYLISTRVIKCSTLVCFAV